MSDAYNMVGLDAYDPFGLSCITSLVKNSPGLLREARKLTQQESAGINSMMEMINKGNMNPGIGTKFFDGITEFRHRDGGRIYADVLGGKVNILGYSGKGNQQKVIDMIKKEKDELLKSGC